MNIRINKVIFRKLLMIRGPWFQRESIRGVYLGNFRTINNSRITRNLNTSQIIHVCHLLWRLPKIQWGSKFSLYLTCLLNQVSLTILTRQKILRIIKIESLIWLNKNVGFLILNLNMKHMNIQRSRRQRPQSAPR